MTPSSRIGCSTISFQHLPLGGALEEIVGIGFTQIDLGALPGVCDHVPSRLDGAAIDEVAAAVARAGVHVRSVNGDVGDFNALSFDRADRDERLDALLRLTARLGAEALVLPCGALGHDPLSATLDEDLDRVAGELRRAAERAADHGVAVWVESLHYLRLCHDRARAEDLHSRLAGADVRPVLDVAHVVAAGDGLDDLIGAWGDRIAHVHLRDAVAGDFNHPFGQGTVDFAAAFRALDDVGFDGVFALELPSAAYSDGATGAIDASAAHAKSALVAAAADRMTELQTSPRTQGATR
ncbi:MAG: sugar phosphate isomerase/epimerase [Microbacterium sp.]